MKVLIMKRDKNQYTYRDPNNLLKEIENGQRSKFIREAVETKIRNSKKTYPQELEVTDDLIKFYSQKLEDCEEQLQKIEQENQNLQKIREKISKKLQKTIEEHETKKNILKKQEELELKDQILETRQYIYHKIILNLLEQKNNPTTQINTEYLMIKGKFKTVKELRKQLTKYIKNNLHEYDQILDRTIFKEDIEYLKKYNGDD